MAIDKIRQRLETEEGFTLIELLMTTMIVSILALIAVPSYLGYRNNAEKVTAQSNVSSAVPAAEGFYGTSGSYANLKRSTLVAQSPGVDPTIKAVALNSGSGYCVEDSNGIFTYDYIGGTATPLGSWQLGVIQPTSCQIATGTAALST